MVTAQLDQVALNRLRLCLGPHDMELTTVSVLDYTLQLGSVIIPRVTVCIPPQCMRADTHLYSSRLLQSAILTGNAAQAGSCSAICHLVRLTA